MAEQPADAVALEINDGHSEEDTKNIPTESQVAGKEEEFPEDNSDDGGDGVITDEEHKEQPPDFLTVDHMRLCKNAFDKLCKEHPAAIGKALSKRQRDQEKLRGVHLAYSEIRFESFAIVLKKIQSKHGGFEETGGIFYDLGSGTGKPVYAAAMLYQWKRCTGIEILDLLHDGARELSDKWDRSKDGLLFFKEEQRQTEIDLINEDFLSDDLSLADAYLVYMNSTTFEQDMLLKLASKCEKMEGETFVVTHTKRLPSVHFDVVEECRLMQSWGECTVFIHKRKKRDWQDERRLREENEQKRRVEKKAELERLRREAELEAADLAELEDENVEQPATEGT